MFQFQKDPQMIQNDAKNKIEYVKKKKPQPKLQKQ